MIARDLRFPDLACYKPFTALAEIQLCSLRIHKHISSSLVLGTLAVAWARMVVQTSWKEIEERLRTLSLLLLGLGAAASRGSFPELAASMSLLHTFWVTASHILTQHGVKDPRKAFWDHI